MIQSAAHCLCGDAPLSVYNPGNSDSSFDSGKYQWLFGEEKRTTLSRWA
jgi:hypothetical protein